MCVSGRLPHPAHRALAAGLLLLEAACGGESVAGRDGAPAVDPSVESAAAPADRTALEVRLAESVAAAGSAPEKAALLIGIDRYAPDTPADFPRLRGCVADTLRVRDVLVDTFGFRPQDVFLLHDEEATHAAIVRAFEHFLLRRAGPTTEVVLYLAGHGSRVPDASDDRGAEPDRRDSTYLAHDSRSGGADGEHDVSDDELRSLLAALAERTPHTLVVTDACHSGGVLRGATRFVARAAPPGTRSLDRDWIEAFWPDGVPFTDDSPDAALAPETYAHVAACRRDQVAYEVLRTDESGRERAHGALTLHLTTALSLARPGDTWRTVVDDAAARLAGEIPGQTVTYAGDLDRPLFGGAFRPARGVPARWLGGGEVLLAVGALAGLRVDSVVVILDARGEHELGEARIVRVAADRARAAWVGPTPDPAPEGALRAVERTRSGGRPPLTLEVDPPELGALLADSPRTSLLAAGAGGEYVLTHTAPGTLRLATAEGVPLHDGPAPTGDEPERGRAELELALEDELAWRTLFELGSERGRYPLEVSFRTARPDELLGLGSKYEYVPLEILAEPTGERPANGEVLVRGSHKDRSRRCVGVLEVANPHDVPVYLSVLSVAESRDIELIHPEAGPGTILRPGETKELRIAFSTPRGWHLERPMRDRYLVLSTVRPADFSIFRREAQLRSAGDAPPPLLAQAFGAAATRGGATVETEDFGIAVQDALVLPPQP